MSSPSVRQAILDAIRALAGSVQVYDLSDYNLISDILTELSTEAILVQFTVADDEMQTISGEGNQGWEETGTVVVHYIFPTGFSSDSAINNGDQIRRGLRGRRLTSELVIESMTPFVDFSSGSIGVTGSVRGFASSLYYVHRDCG